MNVNNTLQCLAQMPDQKFPSENDTIESKVLFYNQTIKWLAECFLGALPPVCQLQLVAINQIEANHYNPNKMAPPENQLLKHSIEKNGLTMPILVNRLKHESRYILVDGFHRYELLSAYPELQSLPGYLPVLVLELPEEKCISASVRHNVARGTHQVELTANLIIQLKQMGWSNQQVCKELGMEQDEVLRMQQITGLAAAFKDQDFSNAWV